MKYMIMMFGSAEQMTQTVDPEWIREMIGFMKQIDKDLTNSGELVFQAGLVDGSQAKVVHYSGGVLTTTDGPYAESKESLVGYWVVDVESEARVIEIAGSIAKWSRQVEVRQLGEAPPEV